MFMKKETYYFSHDSNASSDPKIVQLISIYGYAGYGRYWRLIEMMREQADLMLNLSGKYAVKGLAELLKMSEDEFITFIDDCVNEFHLFERTDDGKIYSQSLLRRMEIVKLKQEKAKQSAFARWKKFESYNANKNDENKIAQVTKENETESQTKRKRNVCAKPASLDEVIALFESRNYFNAKIEAEKFWNYYESNGWKVNKNPMKDWKSAAAGWNLRAKEFSKNHQITNNGAVKNVSAKYDE